MELSAKLRVRLAAAAAARDDPLSKLELALTSFSLNDEAMRDPKTENA